MTLDRARADLDRPIEGLADLVAYFAAGEKPREAWRLGLEHEKIGVHVSTCSPVPYEGERGIGALLEGMARVGGGERVHENGKLVALDDGMASVTIEPGGQLELSGGPTSSALAAARELHRHLDLAKRVGAALDIAWLGVGAHPFHDVGALPRMPKERYRIMRDYLPTRGALALDMMHATASVQASFDYADEADMVKKMRVALGLQAIVAAIYANSSLAGGKATGLVSKRMRIWRDTDPDRCGGIPFVFDPDFGYRRYLEWALDVPLFFVVRDGRYLGRPGLTFRQFMERGHEGHRATLGDFDRHLTTLFPDVRLKRLIEVRGADACEIGLVASVPALWQGLLYDDQASAAAWALVADWSPGEREEVYDAVARRGLEAKSGRHVVLDLARKVVEIAAAGLRRLGDRDETGRSAESLLDPVRAQIALGKSPGQVLVERWEGEWQRRPERLIAASRY